MSASTLFLHLTIGSSVTSIPITNNVPIVLQVSSEEFPDREHCRKFRGTHNFETQLCELRNRNLNNSRKNLALLKKFGGDVEQVISWYDRKENKCNNHSSKLQELQDLGFPYPKKNAVLLRKFNGDIERVKQWYENKGAKKDSKFAAQQQRRSDYSSQLQQLNGLGFKNERKNIKLLNNFDGDVEKVVSWYKSRETERPRGPVCSENYQTQLVSLCDQGYPNRNKNIKLLNKFEGDVSRVIEWYTNKQNTPLPPKFQRLLDEYTTQAATLKQEGFCNQRKSLILLKKFNGDTEKVIAWYRNKHQKQQNKTLPPKFFKLSERFKDQLAFLNENGQFKTKKNIKLLCKFNGDANQVLQWYSKA